MRWLGFLWLCVALVAGDETPTFGDDGRSAAASSSSSSSGSSGDSLDAITDRVAMLTVDRSHPDAWCMGLLIAPDAVLAYAHCVAKYKPTPLSWAFFGTSRAAFFQWQEDNMATESSADGTNVTHRTEVQDVSAGDEDDWVRIEQTTIHPEYTTDATKDLAVVRLAVARISTEPFALAANMTEIDEATAYVMDAFQITNDFVKTSEQTKLLVKKRFHKVGWRYCLPPTTKLTSKLVAVEPDGQVCGVAAVVEERRFEQLPETFVVLDGKLMGLSIVENSTGTSVGHRFLYLSKDADFITSSTQEQNMFMSTRLVVGGTVSPILRGYVSGLRQSKPDKNFCLGSLIAPKFVLTAAHCVVGIEFSQVSVGSMYSSTEIDGEQIKIKQIFIHPAYNKTSFSNDFAIIELEYISIQTPIALYAGSGVETQAGKILTVYGYGADTTDATGKTSPGRLQSVDLPVVDKVQCKKSLQPVVLDESMMCAGGEEGKDACQGDSGGPLVYKTQSPESLVGMPSSGRSCGLKGLPGLYAVVAAAAKFIDEKVDGHRWITSYGSVTVPTTTAPPPTSSAASYKPTSTTTPTPAPSNPQEARSNDHAAATSTPLQASAFLDEIASHERWTQVVSVNMQSSSPSLVIDASYVQLTRDVLSTILLSAPTNTSLVNASLAQLTRYSGATALTFVSNADLGPLASTITRFDKRSLLRRRTTRFPRPSTDIAVASALSQCRL